MYRIQCIIITSLLLICNCSPLPISFLNYFYGFLSGNSTAVHIERGEKRAHKEFGFSFFAGKKSDTASFTKDPINYANTNNPYPAINCYTTTPQFRFNAYTALIGERIFCAFLEAQYAEEAGRRLYGGDIALGVRSCEGPVYWRFFCTSGLSRVFGRALTTHIYDYKRTEYNYYDYKALNPHIGFSLTANTHYPIPINPFLDIKGRYICLYNGYVTSVEQGLLSTTVGLYKGLDRATLTAGFRVDHYAKDLSKKIHPSLLVQATFLVGNK